MKKMIFRSAGAKEREEEKLTFPVSNKEIIRQANFSPQFLYDTAHVAHYLKAAISIRIGNKPNDNKGLAVTYKPITLKTKTANEPPLKGYIAWDQDKFGRGINCTITQSDSPPFRNGLPAKPDTYFIVQNKRGEWDIYYSNGERVYLPKSDELVIEKLQHALQFESKPENVIRAIRYYNCYFVHHNKPIPVEGFKPIQLKISINDLLDGIHQGIYEVEENKEGLIQFWKKNSLNEYSIFSVNLQELSNKQSLPDFSIQSNEHLLLQKKPVAISQETWDILIKNDDHLLAVSEYSINDRDKNPKPLLIVGQEDHKNILRPVTGDADLLWIAPSINLLKFAQSISWGNDNNYLINQEYNTCNPKELEKLIRLYFEIRVALTGQSTAPEAILQKIQSIILNDKKVAAPITDEIRETVTAIPPAEKERITRIASQTGIIRPFEFFLAQCVNDAMKNRNPLLANIFQHGTEISNPGTPSSLNDRMLHFFNGEMFITENEEQLIAFILQEGYLENHLVPIHPKWNIEKWAPVIQKQLALQQDIFIAKETIKNFHAYIYSSTLYKTVEKQKICIMTTDSDEEEIHTKEHLSSRSKKTCPSSDSSTRCLLEKFQPQQENTLVLKENIKIEGYKKFNNPPLKKSESDITYHRTKHYTSYTAAFFSKTNRTTGLLKTNTFTLGQTKTKVH